MFSCPPSYLIRSPATSWLKDPCGLQLGLLLLECLDLGLETSLLDLLELVRLDSREHFLDLCGATILGFSHHNYYYYLV